MGRGVLLLLVVLFTLGCAEKGPVDADGDGFLQDADCDDINMAVHPGAAEVCGDGLDNDCNGLTDCADQACAVDPLCQPIERTPVFMPGTQPGTVRITGVEEKCRFCHGDYADYDPHQTWRGSMMAQAGRDPLALALIAVENKALGGTVGDFCFRCHAAKGWLEGRSEPVSGALLMGEDLGGVQCDLCHRLVDPFSQEGTALVEPVVTYRGSAQMVVSPESTQRGPYGDYEGAHDTLRYEFTTSSDLCATCHDIENFIYDPPAVVEKTYTEWKYSDFSREGVQCQDCHMPPSEGYACSLNMNQEKDYRTDVPRHYFIGGNYWMPDVIPLFRDLEAGTVEALEAMKGWVKDLLEGAAGLEAYQEEDALMVRVTNLAGHKLPTGFAEGRRMWINVRFFDASGRLIKESGKYDLDTGVLVKDGEIKVYQVKPGTKDVEGYAYGPSFHFALNNYIFSDNRIPPRGFSNAEYEAHGAYIRNASYDDGQNWDVTGYSIPEGATRAEVTLYYQTTSKEFIEFLRDENVDNPWDVRGAGKVIHDLWEKTGRAAPAAMASVAVDL